MNTAMRARNERVNKLIRGLETKTYPLRLYGSPEEVDLIVHDGGAVRVLLESVAWQFLDLSA